MYRILKDHPELKPYEADLKLRMELYEKKKKQLLGSSGSLKDFANAHSYFGIHRVPDGWVYREWAPGAEQLWLTGEFNGWNRKSAPLTQVENGCWEIKLPENALHEGSLVKTLVQAKGQVTEHIPLYAKRVLQDNRTYLWSCAITDETKQYPWTDSDFEPSPVCLIYEAHVGMSSEEGRIATYREFADNVLPRVKNGGYTVVQLMAVMEHPYYGSFGYQVSSFYAASSRFGTPDDLKYLVNKAHGMGIRVLLDLVHSHAVKNTAEGINQFDGTDVQFFHEGAEGDHPAWGTKLFDYAKPQVLHFLLSNLKFWLEEYHFDGFRFDGVTSMLYRDHGLGRSFSSLDTYFTMNTDTEAVTYLQLANELIREVKPDALTIAEDMSGMPGMTVPVADGGIGFDYRLAMGEPDMWIKLVKESKDDDWSVTKIYSELTNRNAPTVGYAESHDQALVGDQTLMFRMCGTAMYDAMDVSGSSLVVDRAMALHKLITLVTASAGGTAWLNFMGNEFGHPEWIDFPREGNGWNYDHCRRQWSLSENDGLRYKYLAAFDRDLMTLLKTWPVYEDFWPGLMWQHDADHVLAYERGGLVFVFNFSPTESYTDYEIPVSRGAEHEVVLTSDDFCYGGFGRINHGYYSAFVPGRSGSCLRLYLPSRTAVVLKTKGDMRVVKAAQPATEIKEKSGEK